MTEQILAPDWAENLLYFSAQSVSSKGQRYGGPQVSHQIQILTSNTNSPHQKQIPHNKIKFTTSNTNSPQQKQNRHSKNKFATAKAKSSQQKQIRHIKNKFVTAKTNSSHQKQISHIKINDQFSLGLHPTAILFLHMVLTATFVPIKLRKR